MLTWTELMNAKRTTTDRERATQERIRRQREDRKAERHIDALCRRNPYM